MTSSIRWNGVDVPLNGEESDFLAGLKAQHESGEITDAELSTQVKTLMGFKTKLGASMLDWQATKDLGL